MIVIGSIALEQHIDHLDMSANRDIDVICSSSEMFDWIRGNRNVVSFKPCTHQGKWVAFLKNSRIVEFELAERIKSSDMIATALNNTQSNIITPDGFVGSAIVAPVEFLYLIKMSHRYKKNSPFFKKTHSHIMKMRAQFPHLANILSKDEFATIFETRESESYNYSHPRLNVSKQEFFNPDMGVKYVFDHDEIHQIVARGKNPAYTHFIKDGEQVFCDKNKFFALPWTVQLNAVLEESLVLALERSQIPFKDKIDPRKSFDMALEKVCTSITSGWFREFAWENFSYVEAMYQPDYVKNFFEAVEKGNIVPLNNKQLTPA